jgi:hypothetical protein
MNRIVMHYETWTGNRQANARDKRGFVSRLLTCGLLSICLLGIAFAGPREQAKQIHDRLAGVPPTETVLASLHRNGHRHDQGWRAIQ